MENNELNEELQDMNVVHDNNDVIEANVEITEDVIEIEDKPTKKKKIKGLGDAVKAVTNAVGIETCSDCEERRKKLNKMFPFTRQPKRLMTGNEIVFIEGIKNKLTMEDRLRLGTIYEEVVGGKVRHCNCPGVYKSILDKLRILIGYQNIK